MNSVIPCHRGGHICSWPACAADCDGRPGREASERITRFPGDGKITIETLPPIDKDNWVYRRFVGDK